MTLEAPKWNGLDLAPSKRYTLPVTIYPCSITGYYIYVDQFEQPFSTCLVERTLGKSKVHFKVGNPDEKCFNRRVGGPNYTFKYKKKSESERYGLPPFVYWDWNLKELTAKESNETRDDVGTYDIIITVRITDNGGIETESEEVHLPVTIVQNECCTASLKFTDQILTDQILNFTIIEDPAYVESLKDSNVIVEKKFEPG